MRLAEALRKSDFFDTYTCTIETEFPGWEMSEKHRRNSLCAHLTTDTISISVNQRIFDFFGDPVCDTTISIRRPDEKWHRTFSRAFEETYKPRLTCKEIRDLLPFLALNLSLGFDLSLLDSGWEPEYDFPF